MGAEHLLLTVYFTAVWRVSEREIGGGVVGGGVCRTRMAGGRVGGDRETGAGCLLANGGRRRTMGS